MPKFKKNKKYGFFEAYPRPSIEELEEYYEKSYYQNEAAIYSSSYLKEELEYGKNKLVQKDHIVSEALGDIQGTLLDIGCGEGFTLDYYHQKGWEVTGLDFSDYGLKQYHAHLLDSLIKDDIATSIDNLITSETRFNLIWLDNVLEHVLDPLDLIHKCNQLLEKKGLLVIEVPNDFSKLQLKLKSTNTIEREYWKCYPDHLSYFSSESLQNLLENSGFNTFKIIADFPIEWFLTNENSNYSINEALGKAAHKSRVYIENFLHQSNSLSKLNSFFESLASINQGRQIIGFFLND